MPLGTAPPCNVDPTGSFGSERRGGEGKKEKGGKNVAIGGSAASPLQICMDVLVSQHFVGDPVEDIEYEEAQGKNGSGDGVNALGPVHKTLAERLPIARGDRRRRGEHAGALYGGAVLRLQTVTQSVAPEVEAAALPH